MSEGRKWSYSAGERPNTVIVYEREPGGPLHVRAWDPSLCNGKGGFRRKALRHRDKERAKAYALEQAAKLMNGEKDLRMGRVTLAQVFTLYQQKRTPRKTASEQREDARRVELWTRVLGGGKDPHKVSLGEWEAFVDNRRSGSIDPRGRPVPFGKRAPVRARSVEKDCLWLRWVFGWAEKWRTPQGFYLMRENPVRGFDVPREKNPLRPVATHDRFEAIRKVSDAHEMEVQWRGNREMRRSHLTELLEVVNGTGRRISAVCRLHYEDLRLERTSEHPYGAIRWPADTDKMGKESTTPISPRVRAVLERLVRERPGIGAAPLFPSPKDPTKPISRHLADKWLREGEKAAGVEHLQGGLWHPYRRKWATERKHLPDVDVAQAGGWKNTVSLKTAYQQADPETILRVVLEAGELREAKG